MLQPGGGIAAAVHHGGGGSGNGAASCGQQQLFAGVRAAGASAASRGAASSGAGGGALPLSSQPRAIPGGHGSRGRGRGRGSGSSSSSRGATTKTRATATATAVTAAAAAPSAAATPPASGAALPDLGYARGIEDKYEWGKELGKGGNGVVRVVRDRATGDEWACKSLPKAPPAGAGDRKKAGHLDALRREVEVLRRLEGSLNVVRLVDVFEDDTHVHLVQEWCRGGELHHRVGGAGGGAGGFSAAGPASPLGGSKMGSARPGHHYSERTVASFMRAVLRTLAQCHAQHILHRDVKPGNFMLLDESERSPLRAIDFGLATPYDPDALPLDNLGLEGTPWYMAPEVLSSKVTPASDVWSAGVMAAQLLTGRLPFDDHRNPIAPSLSAVWRSVLTDEVNYNMPWWRDVSPEAREFVATLLDRDPTKRPSAREALRHPWLRGDSQDRAKGKPLDASVVQRLQRFAQNSRFKRSVLQLIAEELLAASPTAQARAQAQAQAKQQAQQQAAAADASASASASARAAAGGHNSSSHGLLSSSVDGGASSVDEGGSTHNGGSTHHTTRGEGSGSGRGRGSSASLGGLGGSAGSLLAGGNIISRPDASPMLALFDRLAFGSADHIDRRQAEEALARMGYRLEPSELGRLVDVVDSSHSGRVRRAALAASQIDWRALQRGTSSSSGNGNGGGNGANGGNGDGNGASGAVRDEWLDVAARAFRALDKDGDGLLRADDIVASLRVKLPEDELRATLAQVMEEAGAGALGAYGGTVGLSSGAPGAEALDFDGFLRVLRVGSLDSLDLYDDRAAFGALGGVGGSGNGNGGDGSGGDSSHGRARAAAAAIAAANELAANNALEANAAKPWMRPHVTFNFNFGFNNNSEAGGAGADGEDGGADEKKAAAAAPTPTSPNANDGDFAASYFREKPAAAGAPFDARMHGASLYRNAAVGGGRPTSHSHLPLATVRE